MASAIEVKRRPSLGDIKVESRLKGGATEEHAHTQADREHGPGGIDPSSTIFQSLSITLNEAVGSATISPSGRDVCLAARKGLYIVDLDDPWAPPRFLPYYSAIVADVQWSPHPSRAHWVMSTSGEKGLVWNLALQGSASPIEHICLGHERALTDMNWAVFQVDTLATCGIDGNVLVYDLRQGGRSPSARYSGWRYGATQVKYNRQNPNELASSHGEYVYIWDDRKGSVPVTIVRAHNQKIYGIDYSRKKADRLVTCSLDSTVKYWHLDGSPEISEPTQTLQTSSPVWRARHTPFGDGLVTLPQRSEYAVKFWSAATQEEVFKLTGHNDIVREFLWRTKGGDNPEDDDRVFQLVTWGSDNQLLLTPIPPAIPQKVGHVPHSPIEVRHLRRNAENRSYRDLLPSPSMLGTSGKSPAPAGMQGGSGLSPTTQLVTTSGSGSHSSGFGQGTKMTHPAHYSPQQQPLSSARLPLSLASASRYGRSANSSSSAGNSPVYGTSPAGDSMMHSRGVYLASDRRVLAGGSSSSMSGSNRYSVSVPRSHSHMHLASSGASMQSPTVPTHSASQFSADSRTSLYDKRAVASPRAPPHPSAQQAPQQQGAFMTRASGRRPRGHEAVDWMENVRIVSGGAQESTQSAGTGGTTMAGSMLVDGVEIGTGMEDSVTALGTADGASTVQGGQGDRDSVPLHEELTALARRFESTVRFEKIAIPQRTITVALYGPWAISGQPTLLRATFVFPPSYPAMSPPNIDIERNNNLSNKVRAKLLIGVRGTAQRYTTKRRNSLEACLTYLLGGKVLEPEDVSDEEDGLADEIAGTHLLIKEEDDVEEEEDLERFLANRNCPAPRRCGAVFTPNGTLITFFPVDSLHQSRHADKRSRSKSPSTDGKKERQHRRRLFESFGVIPSLQVRSAREVGAEEALDDEMEEDSDEVLNIPSLLMTRRRQSRGRTESVGGTSHYTLSRLHGKSFNPRVYMHDCSQIIGIDTSLSSLYTLQGHLPTIVQANCRAISKTDTTWAIKRTWTCLQTMLLAVDSEPLPFHPTRHGTLILGQSLSERLVMDMLDIFYKLGDIQMLGMLSCLLELDRRQLRATTQQQRPRFSRSPANSGALDYFSIKPVRPSRTSNSPHLLQTHSESRNAPPTPQANAPLKSPSAAWLASSYGTQNSGGSGSRGSSWANNLSSFFRAGGTAGFGASGEGSNTARSAGSSTPPIAGQGSTGSISPAFVKRAHMAPLTEVKRAGGIASGRPQIVTKSSRVARGVSFAGADNDSIIPPSRPPSGVIVTPQPRAHGRSNKITIRHTDTFRASEASLFLKPQVQQQLEYYRLLYSDLLLRLQLPLQRTWVLKLTKSAVDGGNVDLIRGLCGIDNDSKHVLRLEFPCPKCKQPLNGRSPGWCNTCHQRRRAAPCVLCHLPLGGLTETCLTCLHTCHLHCLQEWRAQDGGNACPASCGCECATLGTVEASKTEDDGLSDAFKSPLLVV